MAELWVGIDADAGDDVSFHQLRDALDAGADSPRTVRGYGARVSIAEAVGLVTLLYGRALRLAPDGDVSQVPDGALEQWAKWEGEPGVFARAFRRLFTSDGRIMTWDQVAGRLLKYREKEAERKRVARERARAQASADSPRDNPPDGPRDIRPDIHPDVTSVTVDSDRNPSSSPARALRKRPTPALREAVDLAWQDCGLTSEQWEIADCERFWRAWIRIEAEQGLGSIAFYVEDLAALLKGKHGRRVDLVDALVGMDQFSTDAQKVKRQNFQSWILGAAEPPVAGRNGSSGKRQRVDPLNVAASTLALLSDAD